MSRHEDLQTELPRVETLEQSSGVVTGNGNQRPKQWAHSEWIEDIRSEARTIWSAFTCQHRGLPPGCTGRSTPGYTYAVQAGEDGLVKIGHSRVSNECRMVFERLANIQSMSPVKLRVVALIDSPAVEVWLHRNFARYRRHCEWFAPCVANWFRRFGAPGCVRCAVFGDGYRPRKKAR